MKEADYCAVMQKRIQYFAQKYDPLNRYSIKEKPLPQEEEQKPEIEKPKKIRQKVAAGYSYILSFLY